MDNALRLIGIARKAGRIEVGEEPVGAAARARQARLIVLASDAADNTLRRVTHFAEAGNVRFLRCPYTKAELGAALGRSACAMLAFTDAGLAASFAGKLAAADPEKYGEDAQALSTKAGKVLQRQKEQRQHEKNLQRTKSKPWAAPQKSGAERRLEGKRGEGVGAGKPGPKKVREDRSAPSVRAGGADGSPGGGAKTKGGRKPAGTGREKDRGAKARRFDSKDGKKGPGTGTNRNGGRQVT